MRSRVSPKGVNAGPERIRGLKASKKLVEMPLDYVVFLHDQLAANSAALNKVFNESGAQVISQLGADRLVRSTQSPFAMSPLDAAVDRVEGWGMKVTRSRTGGRLRLKVSCPYAKQVHALRSDEHPICPLGEYFLGAYRIEERKALIADNSIDDEGAVIQIKP